ncbi:hypothetical protein [Streptomyces sp. MUM 2J]|uniref:hypothetical protein n=1 Tax=Streptomyces sp. MUM 2J TaxID=2791987 RepID=UPI001F03AFEF|nr:hypothetical protein [Streptomyces sp. MUM 2J]MCH0563607.1 hypothetical protein [Streptomyces sp. MUM 2J]
MIRFEGPESERDIYPLRPLPGTDPAALTCSVSGRVLDLLRLPPVEAAGLDLTDVFRLICENGGVTWKP